MPEDTEQSLRVTAGTLIAAWPDLLDPNFMHSVVLICQHDDQGAFGLVVNRRTELTTSKALPDHPVLGGLDVPLYQGGPVEPTRLQVLHRQPDEIPGGVALTKELSIGGDMDAAAAWLAERGDAAADRLRLVIGYAGWAPGQLEAELELGSWLPVPMAPERALDGGEGEALWRHMVRSVGGDGSGLSDLPPDVSWN